MKKLNSLRPFIFAGTLLLQLSTLVFQSAGAAAGDVDLSFDPGSGVNGNVRTVAMQPDGKVIIGGQFRTVKGLVRRNLARLNADGSGDGSFADVGADQGFSLGDVGDVVLQPDGKVLVGYASGITRLNVDGSFDSNFTAPSTLDDGLLTKPVYAMAVQSDGRILISGPFTIVNATLRNGIARLNADGTLDPTFDPGSGVNGPFAGVLAIAVQSDGKLLIGGRFAGFHETYRPNLVRLNPSGSVDHTFVPGLSENGSVDALALQADGKVLLGGAFNTVHGTNRNSIARLNTNGSLDGSFDPGTGLDGGSISSMALQSNGRVLIGGIFLTVNGMPRNRLARLNANGSLDASFDAGDTFAPGTGAGDRPEPVDLLVQPDGKMIVASVDTIGTRAIYNLVVRLNADGSRDHSFTAGGGLDGGVRSLALQPDGNLVIGGFFEFIDGTVTPGVARLQADGTLDNSFRLDPAADGHFRIVALQTDGKLVVGGDSTIPNGTNTFHGGIARINDDGSLDSSFDSGSGVDGGQVTAIALQQDGKVLIAGGFESVNGVLRVDLVRLNDDGSVDTAFNLNKSNIGGIESVAVQSDGEILVGGQLKFAGDERQYALVRVKADGSRDGSFDFARVGIVTSIGLQQDGKVLVSGAFSTPENAAYPDWIARLNTDGSTDSSFRPNFAFRPDAPQGAGVVSARSLVLQPDAKVLVAGDYYLGDNNGNDTYLQGVYRLNSDGSLDSSFNPGINPNTAVGSIALQPDGNVIIAGDFLVFNGAVRPYVARLYGDTVTPSLNIARSNALMIVSWPSSATGFEVQQNTDLNTPNWTTPSEAVTDNGPTKSISVSPVPGSRFFRLFKP